MTSTMTSTPRRRPDTPAARSPLSTAIREAIAARGVTAYRLAKSSGVDARNIGRWLHGESDLTLASADRLAVALGLRVSEASARKGPRREAPAPVPLPSDVLEQAELPLVAGDDASRGDP